MTWTKEKDWLPLSNAIEQVEFWIEDLQYAVDWLLHLQNMDTQYPKLNLDEELELAKKDVTRSQDKLKTAKLKLQKTKERIDKK